MNDFRKYATKHLGMNGMVLDDVMKSQAKYLNPYILGGASVERYPDGRVLSLDDGPHHLPGYRD